MRRSRHAREHDWMPKKIVGILAVRRGLLIITNPAIRARMPRVIISHEPVAGH